MLDNCVYDKIKLMHDLSKISWFIQQHCKNDLDACKHGGCCDVIKSVQKIVDEQIEVLKKGMKSHV